MEKVNFQKYTICDSQLNSFQNRSKIVILGLKYRKSDNSSKMTIGQLVQILRTTRPNFADNSSKFCGQLIQILTPKKNFCLFFVCAKTNNCFFLKRRSLFREIATFSKLFSEIFHPRTLLWLLGA